MFLLMLITIIYIQGVLPKLLLPLAIPKQELCLKSPVSKEVNCYQPPKTTQTN